MSAEVSHISWLGFITIAIVEVPMLLMVLSALLIRPWKPKPTLVVIGTLFIAASSLLLGFPVISMILQFIVPQ